MTEKPAPSGDLREQLRAAIDAAGRHQVTIARDLGISQKHLCAMLTGRAKLTLEWAERIAEACGREVVVAIVDPDGDLRARLREVIRESHRSLVRTGRLAADVVTDAVLPVVEAETAALRQRAEQAERQRDAALAALRDLIRVAAHVSRGRSAVDVGPYPDALARKALGALDDATVRAALEPPEGT